MKRSGYVYVVTTPGRDVAKVGISRNEPGRRLRQLQTGSPVRLRLHAYRRVDDCLAVEREAHRRLSAKRGVGEWFAVTPERATAVLDAVIADRRPPRRRWRGAALLTLVALFTLTALAWWYGDLALVLVAGISIIVWAVIRSGRRW